VGSTSTERSQVEGLSTPGGAAGKGGIVLELGGETAGAAVVVELRERVKIRVRVGLGQSVAMPEDKGTVCKGRDGSEWSAR
jgi:hypothetical protein